MCVCVCSDPMDYSPWIIAHHAPLSVEFSRQSTGMGYHCNGLRDHPDPRIEPISLASPALVGNLPLRHLRTLDKATHWESETELPKSHHSLHPSWYCNMLILLVWKPNAWDGHLPRTWELLTRQFSPCFLLVPSRNKRNILFSWVLPDLRLFHVADFV